MSRLDGRQLLVCDDGSGRGAALGAELARAGARTALSLLDERPAEAIVAGAVEELGRIDAVVLWGGGARFGKAVARLSLAEWQAQVTRPLRATILLLRELLGHWIGEGEGGDVLVVHGADAVGATAALHSALEALVRSVAKEYGRRRIRCNLLVPSCQDAGTVGPLVQLALSPAFSFVTGQVLAAGARGEQTR